MGLPLLDKPATRAFFSSPTFFVHGVWLVMVLASLYFVHRWGINVPYVDDWELVPYVTGTYPLTLEYLWEQHNEHRIPLPKLVLVALGKVSGGNFRAGMVVNVLGLSALALILIRAAKAIRGRSSYADAVFPLLLLHWGHHEVLLWDFELQFMISTLLLGVVFFLVIRHGDRLTFFQVALLGCCLILLTLCGSQGLPFVLFLSLWLGFTGVRSWMKSDGGERRLGIGMTAFAGLALACLGIYFWNFQRYSGDCQAMTHPPLWSIFKTTIELWSLAFGPATEWIWPLSGLVAAFLFLATNCLLGIAWFKRKDQRNRLLGLLAFNLGIVALTIAIAKSRSGALGFDRHYGFESRFTVLSVPILYSSYLVWGFAGGPALADFAQVVLFTILCFFGLSNNTEGLNYINAYRTPFAKSFLRAVREGKPFYQLVPEFYRPLGYDLDQDGFADYLHMLKRAGIAPYRDIPDDPPFRKVPVAGPPREVKGLNWHLGTGEVTASYPYLDFDLPHAQYVAGIQLTIQYSNPPGAFLRFRRDWQTIYTGYQDPYYQKYWKRRDEEDIFPRLKVFWKSPGQSDFKNVPWYDSASDYYAEEKNLPPTLDEQTVVVWVNNTIDRLRISPDWPMRPETAVGRFPPPDPAHRPCVFTLRAITLLIPDKPMAGSPRAGNEVLK